MKTLVVFYSRTGNTRKVAQELAKRLGGDLEEIKESKDRSGVLGYLFAGRDASLGIKTEIHGLEKDPSKYDLVAIGTPIWAFTLVPPVKEYMMQHKAKMKNVAFFCTCGGTGSERAFSEMEKLCGKKPRATVAINERELGNEKFGQLVATFLKEIG